MWQLVLTNVLIGFATAVVGVIGKAINDWTKRQKVQVEANIVSDKVWQTREAIQAAKVALASGVTSVGTTFIEKVREGAEDGKLTQKDIELARDMAIAEATEIATGPALELLSTWSRNALVSLINGIVEDRKPHSTLQPINID